MAAYLPRLVDGELARLMDAVGAVLIEGPKSVWKDSGGLCRRLLAAVEIKMGQSEVDKAAARLSRFAGKMDTTRQGSPSALIVITATGATGQRPDGVHVAPITALAP